MNKKNIVLIIGQNKANTLFKKSIKTYLSRNDITEIILITYNTENIEFVKSNLNIKKILVPNKKFNLSAEYQKYLYDIGINYINNNYDEENIFVLKTRMDIFISNKQIDFIFSQKYKIDIEKKTLFPYKIWIAWAHLTKPFYIEDACFYSHLSVIKNLSPYTKELFNHQGHSHIRWFLKLAREYNLYNDEKLYDNYHFMTTKFNLDEINKDILLKYRNCIKKHFIIKTLDGGIIFRIWNNINYYKKVSNNLLDIINKKARKNLKIVYNYEDFYNTYF